MFYLFNHPFFSLGMSALFPGNRIQIRINNLIVGGVVGDAGSYLYDGTLFMSS